MGNGDNSYWERFARPLVGRASCPSIGAVQRLQGQTSLLGTVVEVCLKYRLDNEFDRHLHNPIFNGRDA